MLTVASVPAGHPYVESVIDPSRVHLVADPVPRQATLPGQWWPPRFLEPDYLRRHVDGLDLMHVHFGFEEFAVEELRETVDVLRRNRVPLVLTVHDLHNPHFRDSARHEAQLDVLIPAATTLVTLTTGAAAAVLARWGREAVVLPHPHVLPIGAVGAACQSRAVPVVGVHGKGLRANIEPWSIVAALIEADLPVTVRFDLDDEGLQAQPEAAARLANFRRAGVDVRVHPRFTDAELADYLRALDVAVLPYRFGTHSGWAEACYDAGTTVVSPDTGFFAEQHDGPIFAFRNGLDAESLRRAVLLAVQHRRGPGEDLVRRHRRARQRDWVRDRTVGLYDDATAAVAATCVDGSGAMGQSRSYRRVSARPRRSNRSGEHR